MFNENCYLWFISQPLTSLEDKTKMMQIKMFHTMFQHHTRPMSLESMHVRNIREINETLCVKTGNEELMMVKSYKKSYQMVGHYVQHMTSKGVTGLIKKVTKCLMCQAIPQSKDGSEKKKGIINIYLYDN